MHSSIYYQRSSGQRLKYSAVKRSRVWVAALTMASMRVSPPCQLANLNPCINILVSQHQFMELGLPRVQSVCPEVDLLS